MESLWATLVVALAGLAGNAWIASRGLSHQTRMAREAQQEARRTKRQEYLMQLMERLLKAAEDFQSLLGKPDYYQQDEAGGHEHSEVIGRAIAACLAAGDAELREIVEGKDGLTPYRVKRGEDDSTEDYKSRNRNALLKAIKRMAELIQEVE